MTSSPIDDVVRAVVEGNYGEAVGLCEKAHSAGIEAREIITRGLSKGMVETARRYRSKGMYLDSIIRSAATFQLGVASLQPHLEDEKRPSEGRVVVGVPDGPWTFG